MNWAGYILIFLNVLALGVAMAKDGEPRTDKYSFISTLTIFVVVTALYYYGGLF